MSDQNNASELYRLSAAQAVPLLHEGKISPLELVEASAARITETDGALNAMPTLCIERARTHARRIMANGADGRRHSESFARSAGGTDAACKTSPKAQAP
ncbi:MAG: hypothetical protein QF767_13185 [Alphaproteobacteria bacterium]|nr:hypothetical protein [Alphaproteobacteria bacterium]